MIGYYNYTVILTYIGAMFGFAGILFSINTDLKAAMMCLMIAGLCDMFDGKIASTMKRTKQEKRFGIQIDSLSDLICFGALPAILVYKITDGQIHNIIISGAFLLCALIRLAWFNVDEEERQDNSTEARKVYLGMPVTTVALVIPILFALSRIFTWPVEKYLSYVLLVIAVGFITPFKIKKPNLVGKIIMLLIGVAGFVTVIIGVAK